VQANSLDPSGENCMSDDQKRPASTAPTYPRNSVFISYCRKDKKYLDELHAHLAHYERAGIVGYWDDTKILPGSRWSDEISNALASAEIAIFLVSADFFASDFIIDHEMTPLLQAAQDRGIMILSVILGSCVFKDTELGPFQAMNDPSDPLNQMSRGKRDVVWGRVAKYIKKALDALIGNTSA
jgi:hypothetical protein